MLSLHHILSLGFLPGITSTAVRRLVDSGLSFESIVRLRGENLARLGLKRPSIEGMTGSIDYCLERAFEQIEQAERFGARIIHYYSDDYPPSLREIYAAPMVLYLHGTIIEEDAQAVAIVGTRGASTYGRLAAERYARACASAGVTVISGLARGVDTYAHTAAVDGCGRTIAVVASGLDSIQPLYAAALIKRIATHGCVVSEYPFGVKAMPAYFPQRNRIISGMSKGILVVESDVTGGSMITAGFALDQNRELFAIPGPITSPKSRGPNLLIRTDRARLTAEPEDLLDALGYHIPVAQSLAAVAAPEGLTMFEQKLHEALNGEPRHVDDLCEETGLSPNDALVALLGLEFRGLVKQMAGKMFLR